MLVPGVIASFFVGPFALLWFAGCFVFLPTAVYHAIRYFTLTYQIGEGELVIRSGLLFRRERRIPLDRVQEVEVHQGILHRLLTLAKVNLSTAGKDPQEAALNVLTRSDAEKLKSAIATNQIATSLADDAIHSADAALPDYVCNIDWKTLLLGGLTSKVVATFGAIISAVVYFQLFVQVGGNWFNPMSGKVGQQVRERVPSSNHLELVNQLENRLPDLGPLAFLTDFWLDETLAKSILLAIGGLIFTVATYVIRYFNFSLERSGDMLNTSHGLLTIRHGSLARDRIQALKLEEGLLRRWLGLAAIRVDSAGDRNQVEDQKNRDVLLPVAAKEEAQEVARQAIPGLVEINPSWHRISPLAILRGSKKGWMLIVLATLLTFLTSGWLCLAWIPAFPLVYLLNYQWYRNSGYWLSEDYFLWRSGWINRSTVCLPVCNIQNVSVVQNPFDRRLGLAVLSIDIAGQSNTGGGPRIKHLPVDKANRIQHVLADRAAESEFVW